MPSFLPWAHAHIIPAGSDTSEVISKNSARLILVLSIKYKQCGYLFYQLILQGLLGHFWKVFQIPGSSLLKGFCPLVFSFFVSNPVLSLSHPPVLHFQQAAHLHLCPSATSDVTEQGGSQKSILRISGLWLGKCPVSHSMLQIGTWEKMLTENKV